MLVETQNVFPAELVHTTLSRHMLADGFPLVLDMNRSEGLYLYDKLTGKRFVDFFSFFASSPLGMNHPKMRNDPAFVERLLDAAINKISNSDVYTEHMARFVDTFSRVGIPPELPHLFLIEGGAAAVENGIKTAIDWKVRKNFAKGYRTEHGTKVIHFEQAFHGRSGYTMTLTNTDPNKVALFPKYDWPRVTAPVCNVCETPEDMARIIEHENLAIAQLRRHLADYPDDIAAIIIEPIQSEGGDNHFRPEFLRNLREIADAEDIMLIFDEVQTGVGLTGAFWGYQKFEVTPDIITFGKKMQVCGILVGDRVLEVAENVFERASRINSTWGGNLADMVRADRMLEIIEEDHLVAQAERVGVHLLHKIKALQQEFPELVMNPRGVGLMCAFDMPNPEVRDTFRARCYGEGLIILGCGSESIRFRPSLIIDEAGVDEGMEIIRNVLAGLTAG